MEISKVIWSIAGSDNSAGAGIQADVKTGQALGVHTATVVTCVTAQNATSLNDIHVVPTASVRQQLKSLMLENTPAAIKIGALGCTNNAAAVLDFLQAHPLAKKALIVWDPVQMTSTGGNLGILSDSIIHDLLKVADIITPNAIECSILLNREVNHLPSAATALQARGARGVYLKGGHTATPGMDYWCPPLHRSRTELDQHTFWLKGQVLPGIIAHGSGCTLSTALAAAWALGHDLDELPVLAHMLVHQGLRMLMEIGHDFADATPPILQGNWPTKLADLPKISIAETLPPLTAITPFPISDQPLGLYAIVDSIDWVQKCVNWGVPTVQLRIKDVAKTLLREQISKAIKASKNTGTRLYINDYWQLAIELGAYGVHLGQEDLDSADLQTILKSGIRLGISTHSYFEIARAHSVQPSYIAIGPIYPTTIKPMQFAAQGLYKLNRWVELLQRRYPLTAIGGINLNRAPAVLATGVMSFAVVRAITQAQDPRSAVRQLKRCF